jgi:choline dehydrogenase
MTGSGSTFRSATSTASTTRAPTGATRPRPEPGLNDRSIGYARGKVLGGSSSINGNALPARPGPRLRGMGPDHRRFALELGKRAAGVQAERAATGVAPTRCTVTRASGASRSSACTGTCSTATSQAAQQAGIPFTQDYNRGDNFGIGHFEVNQKKGVRWNASKAMLRPVRHRTEPQGRHRHPDRQGGHGRQAKRAASSSAWAVFRIKRHGARIETAADRRRDRLACHPAALRHRSRPRCCRQHGVPLVHDLPRRGRQPPGPPAVAHDLQGTWHQDPQPECQQPLGQGHDGASNTRLFRSGPLSMAPSQLGGFLPFRTRGRHARPGIPRPAPVAGQVRRSPASASPPSPPASATSVRLRAARCRIRDRDPGSGAAHRTELPFDRERPPESPPAPCA